MSRSRLAAGARLKRDAGSCFVLVEDDVRVAVCARPQVCVERADTVLPAVGKPQAFPEHGQLFHVRVFRNTRWVVRPTVSCVWAGRWALRNVCRELRDQGVGVQGAELLAGEVDRETERL